MGTGPAGLGWDLLHPGHLTERLHTYLLLGVTLVPHRAAVHSVITAHGLDKGTAAPVARLEAAASEVIWAAHLAVTLHVPHYVCWDLGEQVRGLVLGGACTVGQIAGGVLRAAVQVVGTADGVRHWATAICPIRQLTAGRIIRTVGPTIRTNDATCLDPLSRDLHCQGLRACVRHAVAVSEVTGGAVGTTVHLIFTAQSLGHGAAPPRAVWHRAARGRLGALDLAVWALDGGA